MKNRIENLSLLPAEPGEFPFSFTHALASSLAASGYAVDRKLVTGASGFAFRIWVEVKTQCPSAMSIFDFNLLKAGVELCGFACTHITRLWHDGTTPSGCWLREATPATQKWREENPEADSQEIANKAIKEAVDHGNAPIAWDIGIPEWGLIAGYDDEKQEYETIDCRGEHGTMPYAQLGKREIPILAVTIPGKPVASLMERAPRTISMAVDHARGREWEDRPAYENGLAAYPAWAALIKNLDQTGFSSQYYVGTFAHFRDCAARWLAWLADTHAMLKPAAEIYARVSEHLKAARDSRNNAAFPSRELLNRMEDSILAAYEAEQLGVAELEKQIALYQKQGG